MADDLLEVTFGPLLLEAGFTRGLELPGSVAYLAEATIERDPSRRGTVMLTLTADAFVLMSFVAPIEDFTSEQIDLARENDDGYSRTELHGSWVLGERIDGGIFENFEGWALVIADIELVMRIRNFLVTRVTALAQYADAVQQRLSGAENEGDRAAVFGPVQRVLDDPSLVTDGHVTPADFVQLVRNAFIVLPEPEMFSAMYAFIRSLEMQALAAGSQDSPWYAVSDGLGDLQREWNWSD